MQVLVLRGAPTHPLDWQRVSMAAPLCDGVGGGGASLCFHVDPGSYDTDSLIEVIGQLRAFLGGAKATLLWDGLPAYAPELNRSSRRGPT